MATFLVLESRTFVAPDGTVRKVVGGDVLDDSAVDVGIIERAGVPLVPFDPAYLPIVELFRVQRASNPSASLITQLVRASAFSAPGAPVGPWAGTLAASASDVELERAGVAAFRPVRDSIYRGITASLSEALGAGGNLAIAVLRNGSPIDTLTMTPGDTFFVKPAPLADAVELAAGDVITVEATTGAIANTPIVAVDLAIAAA